MRYITQLFVNAKPHGYDVSKGSFSAISHQSRVFNADFEAGGG
jgi:hypothetical protein